MSHHNIPNSDALSFMNFKHFLALKRGFSLLLDGKGGISYYKYLSIENFIRNLAHRTRTKKKYVVFQYNFHIFTEFVFPDEVISWMCQKKINLKMSLTYYTEFSFFLKMWMYFYYYTAREKKIRKNLEIVLPNYGHSFYSVKM